MTSSTLSPVRTSPRSTRTAPAAAPAGADGFTALGVPAALAAILTAQGITAPFPIQAATLPDSLRGRDVLGRGRTGSGKTLAFALPLLTRLTAGGRRTRPGHPRGLVLAPTRELVNQITAVLEPLAAVAGLSVTTVFGGVSQHRQVTALRAGVDIVIATPGRLEDLMGQRHIALDAVEVTVLDEADHMADLGFLPGVKRILDATPAGIQRLLFSATLDNGVDVLVRRYMRDPVTHSVDSASSPVAGMTHHVLAVDGPGDKRDVVHELAAGTGRRLLFTRTKHAAKKLAKQLTAAGIPAVDLHGNLSQNARERNLAAFSDGAVRVLVATDIAARGIHVDDVELVVHVDPPVEHKAYLHRSGRTARAGAGGTVVTVMLTEQRGDVRTLMRQAGITAEHSPASAGAPVLRRLVGDRAAHVEPAAAPVPAAGPSGARGRSRPSGGAQAGGGRAGSARAGSARAGTPRSGSPRSGTPRSGGAPRTAVDVSRAGGPRRGR